MTQVILFPITSVLLYGLMAYMPQFGIVGAVFSPLLLLLYLNHEKRSKYSDLMLVSAVGLMAGISYMLPLIYIATVAFCALFVFMYMKKGYLEIWLPVSAAPLLIFTGMAIMIYGLPEYRKELTDFAEKGMLNFINAVKESKNPMADDPYFLAVANQSRMAAESMVLAFPAINYAFAALCTHIAMSLYSKLKKIELPRFRLPDNLVWLLILGFALVFVNQKYIKHGGLNLIIMMLTLYAFQGFDVVNHWFTRFKFPSFLKALIFVFIFAEPPFIIFIALLGLFSVWFNLYGRQENNKEQTPSD